MALSRFVIVLLVALAAAACGGGQQSAQLATEATTTAATTTEPVVEPLSVDENAWLKKVKKIRSRTDRVVTLFKKGCSKYTAAAKNFATMLSVSEPGGGTFVGTPEEKIYNRALDRAFTAQGNGSGLMLLAEQKADQIRQQIEAESGG